MSVTGRAEQIIEHLESAQPLTIEQDKKYLFTVVLQQSDETLVKDHADGKFYTLKTDHIDETRLANVLYWNASEGSTYHCARVNRRWWVVLEEPV